VEGFPGLSIRQTAILKRTNSQFALARGCHVRGSPLSAAVATATRHQKVKYAGLDLATHRTNPVKIISPHILFVTVASKYEFRHEISDIRSFKFSLATNDVQNHCLATYFYIFTHHLCHFHQCIGSPSDHLAKVGLTILFIVDHMGKERISSYTLLSQWQNSGTPHIFTRNSK